MFPITNPYAATDDLQSPSLPTRSHLSGRQAIAIPLIAGSFSLLSGTLAAASYANGGNVLNLLRSDDHFIGGLVVSTPVVGCFAFASLVGWWLDSARVAFWISVSIIACIATTMIAADLLLDFAEGDEFVAATGIGVAIGGAAGLLAFLPRRPIAMVVSFLAPVVLYIASYIYALGKMQAL